METQDIKNMSMSSLIAYRDIIRQSYKNTYGIEYDDKSELQEYKLKVSYAFFEIEDEIHQRVSNVIENINNLRETKKATQ